MKKEDRAETDEFRDVLIKELDQRVEELEKCIELFHKNPEDIALQDDILRTLHSLKGLFSLAGYPQISTIAHHFESVLLSGGGEFTEDEFIKLLTKFADELANFSQALTSSKQPDFLKFDQLTQQLASIDEFIVNLGNQLLVKVYFNAKSKIVSARSLVLINKLKQEATIESYNPSLDDIKDGLSFRELVLTITTQEDEETIKKICEEIQDVDTVHVSRVLEAKRTATENLETTHEQLNVRVKLDDLDKIIRLLGDLVVYGQFIREIGEQQSYMREFRENLLSFERTITNIQDLVIKMRLVPLDTILNRFPRIVRELSEKENKKAELIITGKHIGVDRSIIEQLIDPLNHLIRNAIGHGIEFPEERRKAGKESSGVINLNISQERSDIILEVRDDGKGIDYEAVRTRAIELGLISEDLKLTEEDIHVLLLSSSSLSTATKSTELSGRGVGIATIKRTMDKIGGSIEIDSKPGQYTSFRLIIPLSVAINKVLLLTVKKHHFALPMDDIQQILSVPREKFFQEKEDTGTYIIVNEQPIPIVNLRERFQFNELKGQTITEQPKFAKKEIVVLWRKRDQNIGFIVDELLGEREVVIKPIQDFLKQIGAFSSATVLEGGQVVLIIDPMNFMEVGTSV